MMNDCEHGWLDKTGHRCVLCGSVTPEEQFKRRLAEIDAYWAAVTMFCNHNMIAPTVTVIRDMERMRRAEIKRAYRDILGGATR